VEIALAAGSVVLLAGGITAFVRRNIRPAQALSILGLAVGVVIIGVLADVLSRGTSVGGLWRAAVLIPTTVAATAMAIVILTARESKID
jgi:multisubunit Na+/H+ antiporter MnhE subunit